MRTRRAEIEDVFEEALDQDEGARAAWLDARCAVFICYLDRDGARGPGQWRTRKVITIPAEAADPRRLPPLLQRIAAVPPLVADINLSVDDRILYVSCWGTGELRQYDVSDPFNPSLTGSARLGGIARRDPHPGALGRPLSGGPQMVEVSRDGRRLYVTSSLYSPWDDQSHPDGQSWLARLDAGRNGGLALDARFRCEFEQGVSPRQVRLEGGDASSDSFCLS